MVGDKGENVLDTKIRKLNNKIIDITGKTNFNQLCNILYKSKLTICHDSGIMHIANALKGPLIAPDLLIFQTKPLSKNPKFYFQKISPLPKCMVLISLKMKFSCHFQIIIVLMKLRLKM